MGVFFGTDGIRGKFNDDLNLTLAYDCGNALGSEFSGTKILIGSDTRASGKILTLAFASGAMNSGAAVTDVGVCPTAGISYLTKSLNYDFGVVISASHNPAEFNGIKIFDKTGRKVKDGFENKLEKKFFKHTICGNDHVGTYTFQPKLVAKYFNYLKSAFALNLSGVKVVLDCANGASFSLAPKLFRSLGAKVYLFGAKPNGKNINKNCGALYAENLSKKVIKTNANFGFAFDGDSDRLIAVDENGKVLTGDKLVYIFSKYYSDSDKLHPRVVVGTMHTNMGVEKALNAEGIELVRTEIGDKYVSGVMFENGYLIGGEQSGHVIVKNLLPTGDGILNSLLLSFICVTKNVPLSKLSDITLYPQSNINVEVQDKVQLINSENLSAFVREKEKEIAGRGRIMIRLSGTEPVIRVMVESESESLSQEVSKEIADKITKIDLELRKCVE